MATNINFILSIIEYAQNIAKINNIVCNKEHIRWKHVFKDDSIKSFLEIVGDLDIIFYFIFKDIPACA